MVDTTVLENASELRLLLGTYATANFDLSIAVSAGSAGSSVSASTTIIEGTLAQAPAGPLYLPFYNPVIDDAILNTGTRIFSVVITGKLNGADYTQSYAVTIIDDEATKPVLRGTEGPDANLGTSAAEFIYGLGGNDRINASGGDTIDGGAGLDTVVLPLGSWRAPYNSSGTNWAITSGTNAQIVLHDVERVLLSSTDILALDLSGNAGQGYRMYQAAFARTPDLGGLSYWVNKLDSGMSMRDVAYGFIQSTEFKGIYGSQSTNAQLVAKFYQNVLGRDGEKAGMDYWTGLLDKGVSLIDVLAGFSEAAENLSKVAPAISAGIHLDPTYFA